MSAGNGSGSDNGHGALSMLDLFHEVYPGSYK